MWTEQETKRYEEHLEKHWTRDGYYKPLEWSDTVGLNKVWEDMGYTLMRCIRCQSTNVFTVPQNNKLVQQCGNCKSVHAYN